MFDSFFPTTWDLYDAEKRLAYCADSRFEVDCFADTSVTVPLESVVTVTLICSSSSGTMKETDADLVVVGVVELLGVVTCCELGAVVSARAEVDDGIVACVFVTSAAATVEVPAGTLTFSVLPPETRNPTIATIITIGIATATTIVLLILLLNN
jgi:hypothetical protein